MSVCSADREREWPQAEGPVRTIVIPPCPEPLMRLQAVMAEDDPDWDAIGAIAASDVAMAASLVRAANSPLYLRYGGGAQSVPQAMTLLGLRQTSALLMQFLTMRALPVRHPAMSHFWRTSARRSLALGFIARQLYGTPPDLAHTFGLFCDVGIPVLLQGLRGYGDTWDAARTSQDRSFTAVEQAAHRTDHAVVGALVARTWSLPADLRTALQLHHDVEALDDRRIDAPVRDLMAACVVADHMVLTHEQGLGDSPDWIVRGADCLRHLQVRHDEVVLWQDALQAALDHVT